MNTVRLSEVVEIYGSEEAERLLSFGRHYNNGDGEFWTEEDLAALLEMPHCEPEGGDHEG